MRKCRQRRRKRVPGYADAFVVDLSCYVLGMKIRLTSNLITLEYFLLSVGNCEGLGMDVDNVEHKVWFLVQPLDRRAIDEQLHIRISLGAMICLRAIQNVLKLKLLDDPTALITLSETFNQIYPNKLFEPFKLINLRRKQKFIRTRKSHILRKVLRKSFRNTFTLIIDHHVRKKNFFRCERSKGRPRLSLE